jgi:hypothetical protein
MIRIGFLTFDPHDIVLVEKLHSEFGAEVELTGNRVDPLISVRNILTSGRFDLLIVDEMIGAQIPDPWVTCVEAIRRKDANIPIALFSLVPYEDRAKAKALGVTFLEIDRGHRFVLDQIRQILGQ